MNGSSLFYSSMLKNVFNASNGVSTIGSLLILKEVFTNIGQLVA